MAQETIETSVIAASLPAQQQSYLSWSAVMGGAVVAVAISMVLIPFGAAVGLSAGEPVLSNGTASWNVVVAGLWIVWVALTSAAAGGYIAGRMRTRWSDVPGYGTESDVAHEVEFRDGAHGLVVWAVASLAAGGTGILLSAIPAIGAMADPAGSTTEVPAAVQRIMANASIVLAFSAAAAAAIAAGAAWFAAKLGGEHRDQGIDVNSLVPFFRRRRI
jgi:hypothetical protein